MFFYTLFLAYLNGRKRKVVHNISTPCGNLFQLQLQLCVLFLDAPCRSRPLPLTVQLRLDLLYFLALFGEFALHRL